MRASTIAYTGGDWGRTDIEAADLVLWIGDPAIVGDPEVFARLRLRFPDAVIAGCSSSGEILDGETVEGGAVAAVLAFDRASVRAVEEPIAEGGDAVAVGRALAARLLQPDLRAVCVLGAAPIHPPPFALPMIFAGLAEMLPGVAILGGGAGDAEHSPPMVGLDEPAGACRTVAIGFYGESFRLGFGVGTGWDPLGPVRRVTRAEGPVIYEFDGQPALDLYLRYTGLEAHEFRTRTSRFPFTFWDEAGGEDMVRPVGAIDEAARALLVIQDVRTGASAQMMHCAYDRLIDAGAGAARRALGAVGDAAGLALVTSCIGRRAAMGQYIADESQAIGDELRGLPMIGFYSYGEFGEHARTGRPVIHTNSVAVAVIGEAV